jgi:CRP-like cAMP-binding protein
MDMTQRAIDLITAQLERHAELNADDREALVRMPIKTRSVHAGAFLIREGEALSDHLVLLSGCTQRNKLARSGGRQIVAIQIPGETISYSSLFFDKVDYSTQALTSVEVAEIPRDHFCELVLRRPSIVQAIMKMILVEASISSEWLLNIGRRSAKTRVAHLMCELAARFDRAGMANGVEYDIPLTQEQIGDALGLTAVHVNRMLKELDEETLVIRDGRRVRLPNRTRLEQVADYNGRYF